MKKLFLKITFLSLLATCAQSSMAQTPTNYTPPAPVKRTFRGKMMDKYGGDVLKYQMHSQCSSLNESIWSPHSFSISEKAKCDAAVDSLFANLDANGPLVLMKKTTQLAHDPKVWAWLQYMEHEIVMAYGQQSFFTVWGHTYKYLHHDRGLALEYLAVAFQYTDGDASFPEQLRKAAPTEIYKDYVKLSLFLAPEGGFRWPKLALFPKSVPDFFTLQPYLYHFYVPAYLAYLLFDQHFTARWSFFAPFLMNYKYEMFNQDMANFRNLKNWIESPTLHGDKAKAKAEQDYRGAKLYLGYSGSLFGIGKEQGIATVAEFTARFEKDEDELLLGLEKGKLK